MAKYIDADALIKKLHKKIEKLGEENKLSRDFIEGFMEAFVPMECSPAADVVEVVHARWEECDWVEYDGHFECVHYEKNGRVCTNCRNAFKKDFVEDPRVLFCPRCGAMMDKEE